MPGIGRLLAPGAVSDEGLRDEEIRRIAAEVRSLRAGGVLGALCLEALSRQAEGRTLFCGREWVERRARELGVVASEAATSVGDAVEVLARGPEGPAERAVVAALAARGLAVRLAEAHDDPAQRRALLARFVRHAEWLEAQTEYAPLRVAAAVLDAGEWRALCRAIADAAVDDDGPASDPAALARQAARVAALARLARPGADGAGVDHGRAERGHGDHGRAEAAREALLRVARQARTPAVRALAAATLDGDAAGAWRGPGTQGDGRGDGAELEPSEGDAADTVLDRGAGPLGRTSANRPPAGQTATVRGRVARVPRSLPLEALRWASGAALLGWLARSGAALVGLRVDAEIAVVPGAAGGAAGEGAVVRVRRAVRALGRELRVREATYPLRAVTGAARERRHALVPRLIGATALALGVIVGALLGFDGLRAGEPSLLALAAFAALGGAGLDLLVDALAGARRGAVACTLRLSGEPPLRVVGPSEADAEAFVAAIEREITRAA